MRKLICLIIALAALVISSAAFAMPYEFNDVWLTVDARVGSGANETILVVDWNRLDHGVDTITESHAFSYKWDGDKYESDMLNAFHDASVFTLTTGYEGTFLYNIEYDDSTEVHKHIEEGSWNLASTSDPYARWGTWGDSEWDWNSVGFTEELLANGQFEGINAVMYSGSVPPGADTSFQLDIPILIPEPASMLLFGAGLVGLVGFIRRKRVHESTEKIREIGNKKIGGL